VVRGSLANNLPDQMVDLQAGGRLLQARTDETGRAQFSGIVPGTTVKAIAAVDEERLESQEFVAPAAGGIRLLLVATDKDAKPAAPASTTPVAGQVSLGGQSRIVLEPGDETLQIYYLLNITNTARAPVNPPTLFMFDMPTGAVGTTLLDGSSPQASVDGTSVKVQGPFPPGQTFVQVASELPVSAGVVQMTQRFPATFEQFTVIAKQVGAITLSSPQIATLQAMTADGQAYISASGPSVAAGQPIVLLLSGLPYHSAAPRRITLAVAFGIIVVGVWASRRTGDPADGAAERRRLIARRETLFADLLKLEMDQRNGRGDRARSAARREELVAALEQIYGALDGDDRAPEQAGRAGAGA
jgi:hypothetical protein